MKGIGVAVGCLLALTSAGVAFADDNDAQGPQQVSGSIGGNIELKSQVMRPAPGILGTVTAVSSSTLTINARGTSITVDASGAIIMRMPGTTIQPSDIQIGDTVIVQGAVSGSTITATRIMDSIPAGDRPNPGLGRGDHAWSMNASSVPARVIGEKEGFIMNTLHVINAITKREDGPKIPQQQTIGGTITGTGIDAFVIEVPERGDRATSTVTVSINGSTTYVMVGGASATFADLTAGRFVRIDGTVTSTTTPAIDAHRVEIATTTPMLMGERRSELAQPQGEDQADQGLHLGFFQKFNFGADASTSAPRIQIANALKVLVGKLGGFFHF